VAKRGRKPGNKIQSQALGDFAEDLGRFLGTAEHKARGWLDQRKAIVAQLSQLREKTDSLLRELAEGGANVIATVRLAGKRRGRPPGSGKKTGKRKGRTFTEAQRKAQGRRMKAYWAAKRKAARKGSKKTARTGDAVGNG
jgi:hypothetical protein